MKNTAAARILFLSLAPFAFFDFWMLIACLGAQLQGENGFFHLGPICFELFYMIGGLLLWLALCWISDGPRAAARNRRIWGGHLIFNAAAALFWLLTAGISQTAAAFLPLTVVLPVLAVATNFYLGNFQYQPTTNPKTI